MVAGIERNDNAIQMLMLQLQNTMQKADTDGVSGLSKDELKSISAEKNTDAAAFLKSLNEQFDKIDSDSNGQLSAEELTNSPIVKSVLSQMGPPAGMIIESSSNNSKTTDYSSLIDSLASNYDKISSKLDSSGFKDNIKNMAGNFMQKMFDQYKDVGLNLVTSSLKSII